MTSGAQSGLVSGPTSETTPNVGTATGSVESCATNVSENAGATARSHLGDPLATHPSASRANVTRPATAMTESWNPTSNTVAGCATTPAPTAHANPARPSPRLPHPPASPAASTMPHARNALA